MKLWLRKVHRLFDLVGDHQVTKIVGYLLIITTLFVLGSRAESAKTRADQVALEQIRSNDRQIAGLQAVNARQDKAVDALCRFTTDLRARIAAAQVKLDRSRQFLRDNPNGIPGIPRSLIQQGIADDTRTIEGQRRTLRALATPLDCT